MKLIEEANVKRIAYIIGESSAAAAALSRGDEIRSAGAEPAYFLDGEYIIVGPASPGMKKP